MVPAQFSPVAIGAASTSIRRRLSFWCLWGRSRVPGFICPVCPRVSTECSLAAKTLEAGNSLEVPWKSSLDVLWVCCEWAVVKRAVLAQPFQSGESAANSPEQSGGLQGANRRDRAEYREQKLVRVTSGRLARAQHRGGE